MFLRSKHIVSSFYLIMIIVLWIVLNSKTKYKWNYGIGCHINIYIHTHIILLTLWVLVHTVYFITILWYSLHLRRNDTKWRIKNHCADWLCQLILSGNPSSRPTPWIKTPPSSILKLWPVTVSARLFIFCKL